MHDALEAQCAELIKATREAKELDARCRELRQTIMEQMDTLGLTVVYMDEALIAVVPPSSSMGYSAKHIGMVMPSVIQALIDAERADMVKQITNCYVTQHKSGYIRVKFADEKGGSRNDE